MPEYSLVIQYFLSDSSSGTTSEFFRVEQENDSPEPPTVDQVARALDSVTGQDYCNGTVSAGGFQPTEGFSPTQQKDEFKNFFTNKLSDPLVAADFVQQLGLTQPCTAARALPLDIQLYIFWQTEETAETYRLASTADVDFSQPKNIRETLEKEFTVSELSEINIEYYIDIRDDIPLYLQLEFDWIGNVVDADKNIKRGPVGISIKNNAIISWGEAVSGTFKLKFPTKYHAITATVTPRVVDYSAVVYGVWSGPTVKLPLNVPGKTEDNDCPFKDILDGIGGMGGIGGVSINPDNEEDYKPSGVTCFWDTTHELREACSPNGLIDSWKTIDHVTCPDDVIPTKNMGLRKISDIESESYYRMGSRVIPSYVMQEDPECDECTEEGFSEACCRDLSSGEPIPPCLSIKSTYQGGAEIENGKEYWQKKYPGGVTFQAKMPKEGYCGEKTVEFKIENCDTCGDVPPLEWSSGNPSIIAPGGSVSLVVTGGNPGDNDVTWSLQGGSGYTLTGGGSEYVNGMSVEVFAADDVCGPVTVEADDGCSRASGGLKHTGSIATSQTSVSILPGASTRIYKVGGQYPVTWGTTGSVTIWRGGTPTSRYADITINDGACDGGTVTLSDECSESTCNIINSRTDIATNQTSISMLPGASTRIYKVGGLYPVTWGTTGSVTIWRGGTPTSSYADITINDGACDGGTVTLSDDCSEAQPCEVTNGVAPLSLSGAEELCPPPPGGDTGETGRVYRAGGQAPWDWSVGGSLDVVGGGDQNDSYVDVNNTGGGGTVTVSDPCGSADQDISDSPEEECP